MKKTSKTLIEQTPYTEVRNQPDFCRFPGETEEERVDRLMVKYFVPHYSSQEEFEQDLIEKIEIAHRQIEEGKCRPIEELFEEMEAGFGFHE